MHISEVIMLNLLKFWAQILDSATKTIVSYSSQMATVYNIDYRIIGRMSTPNWQEEIDDE